MKFNKNFFQMVTLLVSMFSVLLAIFTTVYNADLFYKSNVNEIVLALATVIISLLFGTYILQILRRINPKQYIYISYSGKNKEIADLISKTLTEQFEKLTKYRFEIRTADSVPYGEDMYVTMQKYMDESDIIIIIVSEAYIDSDWCRREFNSIIDCSKKIIPIVMNSYNDLSRLSANISNIKALSLQNCTSEKEFERQLLLLAKDLIRQRKD